jgi:hypothetical protein
MAYRIFVSHSLEDSETAYRIKNEIEHTQDATVFLSEDNILLGHMDDAILHEIDVCDLFILLYSKNSDKSHYVQHEVGAARAGKKTIIALLLDENVKPDAMIKNIQYLPIYSPERVAIEIEKLNCYINKQVEIQNQQIAQEKSKKATSNALIVIGAIALIVMYLVYRNNDD